MITLFLIHNAVFYPFETHNNTTKYIKGSISGDLFLNDIYTEQEIRNKYEGNINFHEAKNLKDLIHIYNTSR
jgi:hypothetical protein